MSLSVFMFFLKFLILVTICYSVIFSSAEDAPVVVEKQTRPAVLTIAELEDDGWLSISFGDKSSSKSLPINGEGILAALADPQMLEKIMEAKAFIDAAYALKEEYRNNIKNKKSRIEHIAREAIRYYFAWGSIPTSNLQYPWSSPEKARALIKDDFGYYNLAWEIKSLMDDGRLDDKFLQKGVDRTELRKSLEKELAICGELFEEIYLLEKEFRLMAMPLPSPKHAYSGSMGGGDF